MSQGQTVPKELQDQYDALNNQVKQLDLQIPYYQTLIQNASVSAQQGIVGGSTRIAPVPQANPSPSQSPSPDPSKPPKPGYRLQSDGAGHYRWWNGTSALPAQ
jgi:hypothetical protein